MSEADDALREMAANRGCKLIRSRRRKPGGDHGRFGLNDVVTGKPVFGFDEGKLTATADEIRSFLRGGAATSWKTSLASAGSAARTAPKAKPKPKPKPAASEPKPKPKPAASEPKPKPKRDARPPSKPRPEPKPEPKLVIREAAPKDAQAIAALIAALGYEITAADVRRRLASLRKAGQQALVAEQGTVLGILTTSAMAALHRPKPVGRISMLAVAQTARGGGIGSALVAAAEALLRAKGCGLIEVTSNMKRLRAHGFYERVGFERTSYRFVKAL